MSGSADIGGKFSKEIRVDNAEQCWKREGRKKWTRIEYHWGHCEKSWRSPVCEKPKSGTLPHPRTVVLSQLPLESARFHYEKFPFSKLSGSTQLRRNSAKLRRRVGTRSKRMKKEMSEERAKREIVKLKAMENEAWVLSLFLGTERNSRTSYCVLETLRQNWQNFRWLRGIFVTIIAILSKLIEFGLIPSHH